MYIPGPRTHRDGLRGDHERVLRHDPRPVHLPRVVDLLHHLRRASEQHHTMRGSNHIGTCIAPSCSFRSAALKHLILFHYDSDTPAMLMLPRALAGA